MSKQHDYVPQNAAQFSAFLGNLINYADTKMSAWDNIPQARFTELTASYAAFTAAFNAAAGAHTPAQTLARKEAQAAAAKILRAFVNQFLRFPPVTNVDRVEMGIPNHDTVRTDRKTVTETVDFVVKLSNIRELVIDFWQHGVEGKAKPAGYDGAVIIWGLRDTAPPSPNDLPNHIMASRTPFTLHFDEADRGKKVQIALAWQNERGILGAWSDYKDAFVP
jgi:hypothetical protein